MIYTIEQQKQIVMFRRLVGTGLSQTKQVLEQANWDNQKALELVQKMHGDHSVKFEDLNDVQDDESLYR